MAEILKDWEEIEDTQKGKYLTFDVGEEVYGIEIKHVTEIIGIQPITQVPESHTYIKGIINLRGKIIPVVDVRLKFKKQEIPYNDRTCVVVVDVENMPIGLIVDKVAEVLDIADENIVPPPDNKTGFNNRYVMGIGKVGTDIKLILDCSKLVAAEDMEILDGMR
jgi:purine-binding chemotaxis protein CheW